MDRRKEDWFVSKLIGKPFKCTPEKQSSAGTSRARLSKPVRHRYGVCECDCGTIYVSTILKAKGTKRTYRPAAKECPHCNGRSGEESSTGDWEFKLRERLLRHQCWYQDRTGSARCDHCHKRRVEGQSLYDRKTGDVYLCRECNAVYHQKPPAVETQKHSQHYLYRFNANDQDDPGFENIIRMIEED